MQCRSPVGEWKLKRELGTESNAVPFRGRCPPGGACSGHFAAHAARPGGGPPHVRTSRGSSGARAARWPTARAHACTCPRSALRCSGLSTTNKSQSDISFSILVQFGQHSLMHVLVLCQPTIVLVYLQTNKSQSDISLSILVQFGITVNKMC